MGFGMKFLVLQLTWAQILDRGLLSSALPPPTCTSSTSGTQDHHTAGAGADTVVRNVYLADNSDDAVPYYDCDFVNPFVLVIGSESYGISEEVSPSHDASSA
jgi:hypothetical protein